VRISVSVSVSVRVEETRRGETAESGGFGKWLKQREVRGLYRPPPEGAAGPGGDARQTARKAAVSGGGDT
jgi:hypothetical protein